MRSWPRPPGHAVPLVRDECDTATEKKLHYSLEVNTYTGIKSGLPDLMGDKKSHLFVSVAVAKAGSVGTLTACAGGHSAQLFTQKETDL